MQALLVLQHARSSITKLTLLEVNVPSFAGLFKSTIAVDPSLTCFIINAINLPTPRSINRDWQKKGSYSDQPQMVSRDMRPHVVLYPGFRAPSFVFAESVYLSYQAVDGTCIFSKVEVIHAIDEYISNL